MTSLLKKLLAVILLGILASKVSGFSLLGPFNTFWHTTRLGYQAVDGQIGGPMNLGEEYRWNNRNVYYAIDTSFLSYFGSRGAEEIDKAVKILNDLPPVSEMNIDDFPLKSERINFRAQAVGLVDIKSYTLATMVEEMGLAAPSRFVFTLRSRFLTPAPTTNYLVVMRNFDPVTLRPTGYINGDLWTYSTILDGDTASIPFNTRVDPLAYGNPVADTLEGFSGVGIGTFFTGLTRDDVGGLKYIYHPNNKNVENATTNAFGVGGGALPSPTGGGGGGGGIVGSPWTPIPVGTNTTGGVPVLGGGTVFVPVFIPINTNAAGGGGTPTVTNIPVGPIVTNAFVDTALRSGVDKLNFIKVEYDSLLGQFIAPVLDSWVDTITINQSQFGQNLGRIIAGPDVLFRAQDLIQLAGPETFPIDAAIIARTTADNWQNNLSLNGIPNPAPLTDSGPGVITPGLAITFNKSGPIFLNGPWPVNLDEASGIPLIPVWGSFDGTTNEPVVYPNNISLEDLERQVLGR